MVIFGLHSLSHSKFKKYIWNSKLKNFPFIIMPKYLLFYTWVLSKLLVKVLSPEEQRHVKVIWRPVIGLQRLGTFEETTMMNLDDKFQNLKNTQHTWVIIFMVCKVVHHSSCRFENSLTRDYNLGDSSLSPSRYKMETPEKVQLLERG